MINQKYQITDILKQSKNKTVQKVIDNNKTYFIIKTFDKNDKKYFQSELNVYSLIKEPHLKGFAQIMEAFQSEGKFSIVFQQLGDNVDHLRKKCGGRLTLKCILMIGLQILDRIQEIHKLGYLHGDIKPANFLIGKGKIKHKIYLIDFELSRPYIINGKHIELDHVQSFSGSVKFCSIEANSHTTSSRKDQLQSLIYSLIYLLKGDLPWFNLSGNSSMIDAYNETRQLKKSQVNQLLKGLPDNFGLMLKNIQELKFQEQPKYDYLKNQMKSLMKKNGYEMDYKYDWEYV